MHFPPLLGIIIKSSACRCDGIGRRSGLKMSHASHRSKPGKPCATRVFQNEKSPIFGIGLHFGLQIPKSILEHLSPQAPMPVWWNWQTPGTQNPVSARTCGFDPRHRHHPESLVFTGLSGLFYAFSEVEFRCACLCSPAESGRFSEFLICRKPLYFKGFRRAKFQTVQGIPDQSGSRVYSCSPERKTDF